MGDHMTTVTPDRVLATDVHVHGSDGTTIVCAAGTYPGDDLAAKITNPAAWVVTASSTDITDTVAEMGMEPAAVDALADLAATADISNTTPGSTDFTPEVQAPNPFAHADGAEPPRPPKTDLRTPDPEWSPDGPSDDDSGAQAALDAELTAAIDHVNSASVNALVAELAAIDNPDERDEAARFVLAVDAAGKNRSTLRTRVEELAG